MRISNIFFYLSFFSLLKETKIFLWVPESIAGLGSACCTLWLSDPGLWGGNHLPITSWAPIPTPKGSVEAGGGGAAASASPAESSEAQMANSVTAQFHPGIYPRDTRSAVFWFLTHPNPQGSVGPVVVKEGKNVQCICNRG